MPHALPFEQFERDGGTVEREDDGEERVEVLHRRGQPRGHLAGEGGGASRRVHHRGVLAQAHKQQAFKVESTVIQQSNCYPAVKLSSRKKRSS